MAIRVRVLRGGTLESEHAVEGVVVDQGGNVLAATERPDRVTFFRSSAKPFQLVPLVERGHADQLGLTDRHLALMAASHNGEPMHVEATLEILALAGARVEELECGFHFPEDAASAEFLRAADPSARTAAYNNCSGKHAGMVALARAEGWPVRGYTQPDHPVQQLLRQAIADLCGVDEAATPYAVDGCSASNPALSLLAMAHGFARLAAAGTGEGAPPRERALARIRAAMVAHPDMVAGTGRFCTDFMRVTAGRMATKTGAEGLQLVAIPGRNLGVAVKVLDGSRRASAPALVGWLHALGLIDEAEVAALAAHAAPRITNHRQLVVGTLAATGFPGWRAAAGAPSSTQERAFAGETPP
ncbi:MAG: asparaginase [Candidatus Eisenbacteria bacterium]